MPRSLKSLRTFHSQAFTSSRLADFRFARSRRYNKTLAHFGSRSSTSTYGTSSAFLLASSKKQRRASSRKIARRTKTDKLSPRARATRSRSCRSRLSRRMPNRVFIRVKEIGTASKLTVPATEKEANAFGRGLPESRTKNDRNSKNPNESKVFDFVRHSRTRWGRQSSKSWDA